MHKIVSTTYLLMLLLFAACRNTAIQDFNEDITKAEFTIKIPHLSDSVYLDYSNIFSNIEYIPLETTPSSIIGHVDKLEITEQGDYIILDRHNNKVLRFDKNGRFLNKIGMVGKKKDEYIMLNDMTYDSLSNHIIIWDNPRHSLLEYRLDGKMTGRSEIEYWNGQMAMMGNNTLILVADGDSEGGDYSKRYIKMERNELDEKWSTVKNGKYTESYSTNIGFMLSETHITNNTDNNLLFLEEYSPLIYILKDHSLKPKYKIEFADGNIPVEWMELSEDKFRNNMNKTQGFAYCYKFYVTQKYYVMVVCKDMLYLCVLKKDVSDKTGRCGYVTHNDMTKIRCFDEMKIFSGEVSPIMVKDDVCYFVEDADKFSIENKRVKDINEYLVKNKQETLCIDTLAPEFRRLKELSENINPVIVACKLK